jgi:hypothetical protein
MRTEHCSLNILLPMSYSLRQKGEGDYDESHENHSVSFIFSVSMAALLRRKPLSTWASRDTYPAQEKDKINPADFQQLAYLTNICRLWILATSWEWCTCTNTDNLSVYHRPLI